MAINLSTLAGKLARIEVPFMGQTCKVTYDPMVLTQERINAIKTDAEFADMFCDLVKSWDVMKGNKKVPLTKNGVNSVPMILVKAIYAAIQVDGQGDPDEGKDSNGS